MRSLASDPDDRREEWYLYLASRPWKLLKKQVMERANGTCERCHRAPVYSTHHRTYRRAFNEELDDLVALCWDCHEFETGNSDYDPLDAPPPDGVGYLLDGEVA